MVVFDVDANSSSLPKAGILVVLVEALLVRPSPKEGPDEMTINYSTSKYYTKTTKIPAFSWELVW
jgi:hypothetical protein